MEYDWSTAASAEWFSGVSSSDIFVIVRSSMAAFACAMPFSSFIVSFGARMGRMIFARMSERIIYPPAMKSRISRTWNVFTVPRVTGSENARIREMVPFAPPKVMIRADLADFGVRADIPIRVPVCVLRLNICSPINHRKRARSSITVIATIASSSIGVLTRGLLRLVLIARGSSIPRRTNTLPFNAKVTNFHTESDTRFVRAISLPTPILL